MRVAIACLGVQGDTLPLLEIAQRLRMAGHEVAFGSNPDVATVVERAGFDPFVYTSINIRDFLASEQGRRSFFERGTVTQLRTMGALYHRYSAEIDRGLIKLCDGADCVITGRLLQEKLALINEPAGRPIISVHFFPLSPSAHVASPLVGAAFQRLRYPLSRLTHQLVDLGWDLSTLRDSMSLARRVGHPRWIRRPSTAFRRSEHLIVEAFGTAIIPPNKRDRANCRRIGFIRSTASPSSHLPANLLRWLEAHDDPLVYLGFGSMPVPEFARLATQFDALCATRGYRAVVAAGWCDAPQIDTPSDRIRLVSEVDHAALFPLCTVLVHHGGAGTVATGIASGTPAVVCSQGFDQYFWGQSLRRLGVGEVIARQGLTATAVADAIDRLRADSVQNAAKRLATRIRGDLHGADQFMAVFDEMMAANSGRTAGSQRE